MDHSVLDFADGGASPITAAPGQGPGVVFLGGFRSWT